MPWLRAYCSDTNYNSTVNVDVHFLESGPYLFKNRESNKYMSVEGHSTAAGARLYRRAIRASSGRNFICRGILLQGIYESKTGTARSIWG